MTCLKIRFGLFLILMILVGGRANAQVQDSLYPKIKHVIYPNTSIPSLTPQLKKFRGSNDTSRISEVKALVERRMADRGYSAFSIDSALVQKDTITLSVDPGMVYFLDSLLVENVNETYAERAGLQRTMEKGGPLSWQKINNQLKLCLNEYENNGYPFAAFQITDLSYAPMRDTIWTRLQLEFNPGKQVLIDSLQVIGDIREKPEFVYRMAGLAEGDLFDQSKLTQARRALNGSIYFRNVKEPKVVFLDDESAKVILEMESRKSGKFDVLLGVLPPREQGAKMQFTGLIDIQLVSPIFKAGEMIQFRYDKLIGSSQKLHLQYGHPYLFGSPIKVQGEFDLLKQDTTFLTRWSRFAASYAITQNLALRVSFKGKRSTLISTDRFEQDSTVVPPVLDGKDQTYSLGFEFENLDYRLNPRRGFQISADIGIGNKRVIKNPRLHEQIYNSLDLDLRKTELDIRADWYYGYTKRMVLRLGNRTYWLDQDQYFQNDLLQAGGSRFLRGFNENEFFANLLTMFTLENRFILEENSYLFVFSDYAYLEDATAATSVLRPWGLGLGLTYETKAGILGVTYAVGQAGDKTFQPGRGRIHIGLINQF